MTKKARGGNSKMQARHHLLILVSLLQGLNLTPPPIRAIVRVVFDRRVSRPGNANDPVIAGFSQALHATGLGSSMRGFCSFPRHRPFVSRATNSGLHHNHFAPNPASSPNLMERMEMAAMGMRMAIDGKSDGEGNDNENPPTRQRTN
jgi:hypothetical protein